MSPKRLEKRNRRGFIFIYAYLLIVLFMVYELALLTYFAQNINAFERFSNNTIAYQLAEAGLDSAMAKLKNNSIVFDANGNYTETRNFILGNYNVTVSNQQEDLDGDGALDGPLAPNTFRITTFAAAPTTVSPGRRVQQSTNVVAYVRKEDAPAFEYAVNTRTRFVVFGGTGLTIDSYDSRNGTYGPDNESTAGNVRIGNDFAGSSTLISGDVVVGQPDNARLGLLVVETDLEMNSRSNSVTGTVSGAVESNLNIPTETTNTPQSGRLIVGRGETLVLAPGIHHFEGVSVGQGATLSSSGPVQIYVSDSCNDCINIGINATVGAETKAPSDFLLFVAGGERGHPHIHDNLSMNIGNGSVVYGGIHAPNADVRLSRAAEIFGAMVVHSFVVGERVSIPLGSRRAPLMLLDLAKIHFDEAMRDIGGASAEMNLVSWRTVPVETSSTDSSS